METAVGAIGGRTPLIVGVGTLRTDDAQALARDAESAGADAVLMAPVSYTPLTEDEVFQHYVAVAGATALPLCIYNNPTTTHFAFSPALLARLAAVPNIVAVKMPAPQDADFAGELGRLRGTTTADFTIGYSGDNSAADALLAGADTWFSVVGGLLPMPALRLTQAARAGDIAETHRLNGLFQPLWQLFRQFGGVRVMFAAANELGMTSALPPRPILPLDAPDRRRVAEALESISAMPG